MYLPQSRYTASKLLLWMRDLAGSFFLFLHKMWNNHLFLQRKTFLDLPKVTDAGNLSRTFLVPEDWNQSHIVLGRRVTQKSYFWPLLPLLNVMSRSLVPKPLPWNAQHITMRCLLQKTAPAPKVACFLTLILWFAFRQIASAQPRPSPVLKLSNRQIIPTLGRTKK